MAIPYEPKPLPTVTTVDFNVSRWAGVNKIKGSQADYEMVDCKNMCSDNFPYASPRKSREKLVDEAGIKRIYKVEGDRIYYIDKDDYLCYLENGEKSYVTYTENDVETKIQIADCTCTNNYDNNSVFYPAIKYIDEENKIYSIKYAFDLGEVIGPEVYYNSSGEEKYRLKIESKLFIDNISATTFNVNVKFPSAEDLKFPSDRSYENYLTLNFNLYGKNNRFKESFKIQWNSTDNRKKTWTLNYSNFEEGDYFIVTDRYNVDDATTISTEKKRLEFLISGEWSVEAFVENGVTKGNPCVTPLDYGVVYNNRIVGVTGSDIRASALGDFTNFHEYADEAGNTSATGAYATDVGSAGDFTGICAYNNVLLLFKKDIVYEMYGSMPYTITELCTTGCIDNDSIASIDGVLYWASPKGIVRYSGGVPVVISQQIDIDTSGKCKAGTDGRKYYVYDGKRTFVYDTYYQMWHIEDEKEVEMYYNHINDLYAVCNDGIYKLSSGNEAVEWEFETKEYTFGSKERKNLSKMWIRADMPKNTRLEIWVKQNGGQWLRSAVKTAEKDEMFDFKLRVKKCDSFALKFKGKGDVRILDIHGKITVGTSKHRSGESLNVYRR